MAESFADSRNQLPATSPFDSNQLLTPLNSDQLNNSTDLNLIQYYEWHNLINQSQDVLNLIQFWRLHLLYIYVQ